MLLGDLYQNFMKMNTRISVRISTIQGFFGKFQNDRLQFSEKVISFMNQFSG